MSKRSIIIAAVFAVVVIAILILTPVVKNNFFIGEEPKFSGTRTRNTETDTFEMTFEVFNRDDHESFNLKAGEELKISWNIEKGSVTLYVLDENKKEIYRADDRRAKDEATFSVAAPDSGEYTVYFTGKKAAGSIKVEHK